MTESEKGVIPLKFESLGLHAGVERKDDASPEVPVFASTSFAFNNSAHGAAIFKSQVEAFCYSRIGNPTVDVVEKRVAELEGGIAALAVASGEAAIYVVITTLAKAGENIVVASPVGDATGHQLKFGLLRHGITTRFVESGAVKEVANAIDENTKAVFVESVSMQKLQVADLEVLATVAHEAGVPFVVDNTAGAGGFLIRPISHGADIVVDSAAEWLSISGSVRAGIIIDSGNFNWKDHSKRFPQFTEPQPGVHGLVMWESFGERSFIVFARSAVLRDIGPCLNPFEASLLIAGLETLSVRMERHSQNAGSLSTWLVDNSARIGIRSIHYPVLASGSSLSAKYFGKNRGFGGVLAFELTEEVNESRVENFFQDSRVVSRGNLIGGSKTVVIFHDMGDLDEKQEQDRKTFAYVSVGLENIDDIIADFELALRGSAAKA